MSFTFTNAKKLMLNGQLDLEGADIYVTLVMMSCNATTNEDATTVGAFTLDEFDGLVSGVAFSPAQLTTNVVTAENASNLGKFDNDDVTWLAVTAGTSDIKAAIIYKDNGGGANRIPIYYIDGTGFPASPTGQNVVLQWSASGIAAVV